MAHIISSNQDAIAYHRELQRQLKAEEITPGEYQAAFRAVDAAASVRVMCDNNDGRLATVVLGGRHVCSACWVAERGKRGRV